MAYSTPPTFADGNILTATQLNTLSANQEYLKGVIDAPNVPSIQVGDNADFWFRHTLPYFHWYFYVNNGSTVDKVEIKIYSDDGSLQFDAALISDTSTPANQAAALALDPSYRDSYDVSALTIGNRSKDAVDIDTSRS